MSSQNYYEILGVGRDASSVDIKKAYRKLAMKYHPDQTKDDKKLEKKFKYINEAYAVLKNKEKRKQYDNFGHTNFHQKYTKEDIFKDFNLGDIFKEFGFGVRSKKFSVNGVQFNTDQEYSKGTDLSCEIFLTLREVALGTTKTVVLKLGKDTENIVVKIPPGMISGKKLRLVGKGSPSQYGGQAGDLYVKSTIIPDSQFIVKDCNYDLIYKCNIQLTQALLGTRVLISTVDGGQLNIKIPSGTKHKTKMRLPGYGLPYMNSLKKGDLYVVIHVDMPLKFSDKQRKILEDLSNTGI